MTEAYARTDLAMEACELLSKEETYKGIETEMKRTDGIEITTVRITNDNAAEAVGKPKGTYISIEADKMKGADADFRQKVIEITADMLKTVLNSDREKNILVAGLGNMEITPDSLGPKTSRRVLATRHISGEIARSTGLDRLRPVAVMQTGVTGQTGIETGEYILSIVKRIKPNAVVVIDALASRRLERLGCTLQISDTGISPGAGVGNHRTKINKETIGVPVIAIGVPTVVDAATFASDLLSVNDPHRARQKITPQGRQMVVIPREIDLLTERASRLISFALNGELVSLM